MAVTAQGVGPGIELCFVETALPVVDKGAHASGAKQPIVAPVQVEVHAGPGPVVGSSTESGPHRIQDMFIALDVRSDEVWYGALRIELLKFHFSAPAVHTLHSRHEPSPAKAVATAIEAVYAIPLPPVASDVGTVRLPVINVGMLGGGTVTNAIPGEAWFTVDLRSLDTATQERLRTAITDAARRAADDEHVDFRFEQLSVRRNYSKALPREQRLTHPLVTTAVDAANYFRQPGSAPVVPIDIGSTGANFAVGIGIPAIATGTLIVGNDHQLDEYAEASSIVPGIKQLISLAVDLTTH